MDSKFYVATSIVYVNDKPHLGFAMELIQGDCIARFQRLEGKDVFFLTGTDMHGVKIYQKAKEFKMSPLKFAKQNTELYIKLCQQLNISYNDFITTEDTRHKNTVQEIWTKLYKKNDLYLKKYKGLYCVGCESFKQKSELKNGECIFHKGKKLQEVEEENYFFKLSKYKDIIKEKILTGEFNITPQYRANEIINILDSNLSDISFSRLKTSLPWGIDVPNNPEHVIYVWCDALANYISGVGYHDDPKKFEKYWPTDLNIVGKDISKFHAIIWIAMLLSLELALPKRLYIHEFITNNGQKMSKSLGNVISPNEIIEKFGTDALRFFLLKETYRSQDTDFTWSRFRDLYESHLVNGLGNLIHRVFIMVGRYCRGKIPKGDLEPQIKDMLISVWRDYKNSMNNIDFREAIENIMSLVFFANKYIADNQPWTLIKKDNKKFEIIMRNVLEMIAHISVLISPFIPETSRKIRNVLNINLPRLIYRDKFLDDNGFIKRISILFPKSEELLQNVKI